MSKRPGGFGINAVEQDGEQLLPPAVLHLMERLAVAAKGGGRGGLQGKRRSRNVGSSLEFADFRPYVPGDDIRRIDWNVYGRTGRAFIRQYWDEQQICVHLLVDASRSMTFGYPRKDGNKFYYALQLAACIGYAALAGEDRVAVKLFAEQMSEELPFMRGRSSVFRLIRFLDEQWRTLSGGAGNGGGSGNMAHAFMAASPLLPRHTGQTWLFSDGLYEQGMEETLDRLIGSGQQVVFVHTLSPDELRPELQGELRLIDSELGTGKDVAFGSGVMNAYRQALHEHCEYLSVLCGRREIGYVPVDTGVPLEQTIHRLFLATGLLRG
ncbi:DUF58 domain-containing protein [Paenibacillus sp. GCM10027626]|uniref:DUF58 domain-containing protein n=1 Tax=Paenibacillus sp. GCM10027626 TaxID=3273411 RepID=UPI003629E685